MVRELAPSCARRRRLYYDPDYQHRARRTRVTSPTLSSTHSRTYEEITINCRETGATAVIHDSAIATRWIIVPVLKLLSPQLIFINTVNVPSLNLRPRNYEDLFEHYFGENNNNELL